MEFVDRKQEIALLEREYVSEAASLVVVYGRRRVGKTALLTQFIKEKPAIYFLATEESELMNRQVFQSLAAEYLDDALLGEAVLSRWEPIFERLVQSIRQERLVIVLDEFQYIGKSSPAFLSVFQRIWDQCLCKANVMVVLCGSLISMMMSQTLSYDSPIYGRRTAQLRLRPVCFEYYADFFAKDMARDQLVSYYSVTGGIPKYIEMFRRAGALEQGIQDCVLDPGSFLYDEPNFLLQREVADVGSYFSIMRAIAAGNHKLSKIATVLQQKQTSIPRYLRVLIDLNLLEREVPVTESNPEKSKRGVYKIRDPFLAFWFQFVYPSRSYLESGHQELVLRRIQQNFIDNRVSFIYEDICRERLWKMSAEGDLPCLLNKVGRWWDNAGNEIDVVGLAEDEGVLVLGECKFWQGVVGVNVLQSLECKAALVHWKAEPHKMVYVLFSIHGFSEDLQQLATLRQDVILMS